MPLFSIGKKEKALLALDLGSEAAKAVAFNKEKEGVKILGHSLRYFEGTGLFGAENFYQKTAQKTVSDLIDEIKKRSGKIFTEAWLTLSPDVLNAEISSQTYARISGRKKISEKEEKEIMQVILGEAEEEISKQFSLKSGILPADVQFLGSRITEIKIDGYEVPKMVGFEGEIIYARILTVFAPKYYLERISGVLGKQGIKITKIVHPAEVLPAVFSKTAKDGIFMDIGGEITQVILLKKGKIDSLGKINSGGKNLTETISKILGMSIPDARMLKERYSKGELSKESSERIKKIIFEDLQEFFSALKERLSDFSATSAKNLFLYGGASNLPEIGEILKEGKQKEMTFEAFPDLKIISPFKIRPDINAPKINDPQFTQLFLIII